MNGPTGNSPNPTRPNLARLLGLLVIPVLLVVFTMVLSRGSMLDASPKTRVYNFKDGVWSPAAALPGAAGDIQVSPGGVVWVSTSFHAGLSRTTAGQWTSYARDSPGWKKFARQLV
jgi:hypothetical protein